MRTSLSALVFAALAVGAAACGDDDVVTPPSGDSGAPDAMLDATVDGGVGPVICQARVPVGGVCTVISECDDGCYCDGAERCEAGVCVAGTEPCGDGVGCTVDSCNESVRSCAHVPSAASCSDSDLCNGAERCDVALGCLPGSPPVCDDEDTCTTDTCDPADGCINVPQDRDGDGFGDGFCGGTDCLDDPALGGASVGPGMSEICDNDLDDDCDGLRDYATPSCIPANDTCATARVLPGAGSYSGSTRTLRDDYGLRCPDGFPGGSVADAVFRVTLAETQDIAVRVRGGGSMFGPQMLVTLRRFEDCATGPALLDTVCGTSPSLRVRSAPAGDYAIIVSAEAVGGFDLIVELTAPTLPPPIDTCDASTLDVSAGGSFRATRWDIRDDYSLGCNAVVPPSTRADAAYRLTLDTAKDVRIDLQPQGALALMRDCAVPGSALTCVPLRFGSGSSIFRRALPAGTYFIVAEPDFGGRPSTTEDFVLDVRVSEPSAAPPGDSCSSAVALVPSVELATSVDALDLDVGVSCGSTSWPLARDVVFTFTTAIVQDVTFRVNTPVGPFGSDAPTIVLTSTCGDAAGERSCGFTEGGNTIERTWRSLPAGTWYAVAATSATSGSLSALLTVAAATPVPVNDGCDGATELVSGTAVLFSPASYEDDLALSCGRGASPDAIYRFTLPRRQTVDIIASPVGASALTRVALRSACTGSDLACSEAGPSSISTILDPGTYYVVVEADPFVPQVRVTPFFSDI